MSTTVTSSTDWNLGPSGVTDFVVPSITTKLGLYQGGNSSAQQVTPTAVGTTAATSTTPYGFGSQAQADAVVTAVNAIITKLAAIGVWA